MRRLAKHGAVVFAGILGGYGATYVYYVMCARALGVERYGLLSALLAVVMLGALPASFVTIVIAKTAATLRAKNDFAGLAVMAAQSSRIALPVAVLAVILTAVGGGALSAFFRLDDRLAVWLLAGATTLVAVLPLQRAVLQGAGEFGAYALSTALEGITRAAIGLAVFFFGGGVRLALAAFVVAGLAAFFVDIIFLRRAAPGHNGSGPRFRIGDAALTALPMAAITLMTFADVAVARHVLSSHEAGLYGTVSLAGRALITVITAIPTVLLPAAVARAVEGRSSIQLLGAALGVGLSVALVMVLACAWNPPLVLSLLGGRAYLDGSPLVVPYSLASSALAGATIIATYLTGIHRSYVGIPLMAIALAEPLAILLGAHDARAAVTVVDIGHTSALGACAIAIAIAVAPRGLRRSTSP